MAAMRWLPVAVCALLSAPLAAQDAASRVRALLEAAGGDGVIATSIGVTRRGTPIPALLRPEHLDPAASGPRVLVVAGLDGSEASVEAALRAWRDSANSPVRVSVAPVGNPDGWGAGPGNDVGGAPATGYPPEEPSYLSPTDPEKQYLWRWIGLHAPDLVIEVAGGERFRWMRSNAAALDALAEGIGAAAPAPADSLTAAMGAHAPAGVGTIPALRVEVTAQNNDVWGPLSAQLEPIAALGPSPARKEIAARVARKPLEVARQLAAVYGHQLDSVVYIPAMALVGRLRLGSLTGADGHLADIERIVKPYLDGAPTLPEKPTSSHWPGHLIFGELAKATGNAAYVRLAMRAGRSSPHSRSRAPRSR